MAKKKEVVLEGGPIEPVEGTVEWERQQFFEREKAAYEERTGETVNYVPPTPLTSTPLPEPVSSEQPAVSSEPGEPEGEG